MPKISAATVAQHRDEQIRAILDASIELMREDGALPGMGRIASRAGLARSSIYQYFPSRRELLIAITEDMTPRWLARVTGSMDRHTAPAERILAYLEANVELVASGDHAAGDALAAEPGIQEFVQNHAQALHERLLEPLVHELERLGVDDAEHYAVFLNAQLHTATGLLAQGLPAARVWKLLRSITEPFLRSHEERD